jgi:hypothetical protein
MEKFSISELKIMREVILEEWQYLVTEDGDREKIKKLSEAIKMINDEFSKRAFRLVDELKLKTKK